MRAIFPGTCVVCHQPIVNGDEIADTGLRGPRGGKKMGHARCVARGNPYVTMAHPVGWQRAYNNPAPIVSGRGMVNWTADLPHTSRRNPIPSGRGMAIPGDWPDADYQWGEDPQVANWTSDPQYSYEQFYRANPAVARQNFFGFGKKEQKKLSAEAQRLQAEYDRLTAMLGTVPRNSDPYLDILGQRNVIERQLDRALAMANPQYLGRPVYVQMPDNAGPYLPQMFPYGVGGRPAEYVTTPPPKAKKNRSKARRNRGPRGGFSGPERSVLPDWYFLKPSSRGWPAGDPARGARDDMHAREVIVFMVRGFGNRSEYPGLIRKLAKRYSVEDDRNRHIWLFYRQQRANIERMTGKAMPSVMDLRRLETAAANPRRRKKRRR